LKAPYLARVALLSYDWIRHSASRQRGNWIEVYDFWRDQSPIFRSRSYLNPRSHYSGNFEQVQGRFHLVCWGGVVPLWNLSGRARVYRRARCKGNADRLRVLSFYAFSLPVIFNPTQLRHHNHKDIPVGASKRSCLSDPVLPTWNSDQRPHSDVAEFPVPISVT